VRQENKMFGKSCLCFMDKSTNTWYYLCKQKKDCHQKFKTRIEMDRHLARHRNEKDFKCILCKFTFSSTKNLEKHVLWHAKEKPYHCTWPGCNKAFSTQSALYQHNRMHMDKKYDCPFPGCGYKSVSKSAMNSHSARHFHGVPGWKWIRCERCRQKFISEEEKSKHQERSHIYVCQFSNCNKGYKNKHSLKGHGNIHTGKKPYKCQCCNETFSHGKIHWLHEKKCSCFDDEDDKEGSETGEEEEN